MFGDRLGSRLTCWWPLGYRKQGASAPPSTLAGLQWSRTRASSSSVSKSLRRLKRFSMRTQILKELYSLNIESILTGCITAWYDNCSASNRKELQDGSADSPVHHWGQALPSRTSISGGVKGRPGKWLKTPATQAIDWY